MSSTSELYNMPSTSEDSILISKAVKKISFLENEVHKLTDQLRLKESLLDEALDLAAKQSEMLAQLSISVLHDDTIP